MYMKTKKELIKMYSNNELHDSTSYNPSAFDAYIIIELNQDYAFGFYEYDNEKTFFKRKLYSSSNQGDYYYYFVVDGERLLLDDFMRFSTTI